MKYSYLIKENHKTKNMISENEKSLLSTNEDFKLFLNKNLSKKKEQVKLDNNYLYKEITDLSESSDIVKNNQKINCDNNSVIFESEINTVEILVKYTSNIYNLFIKLIMLITNLFINTYEKIPSNYLLNEENNDENKIIKKLNELIKIKTKTKTKSKTKDKSKNIKEINSYLIDLD
jgi:hypothetical protein